MAIRNGSPFCLFVELLLHHCYRETAIRKKAGEAPQGRV